MSIDPGHACIVDLDGVVWLSGEALPGATAGVTELRRRNVPILFATNNSAPTVVELRGKLAALGIDASDDEIVTSAHAAASLLDPGNRAHVVGGDGLRDALGSHGVDVVTGDARADAVVVGLDIHFDYDACDRAAALVREGARFIATNTDATLPTPHGLRPGAGAIVTAIEVAAGRRPEVAGKPHKAMCELVLARVRPGAVVGDRASTDGRFAAALGVAFAHVVSSVGEAPTDGEISVGSLLDAVRALCGDATST